MIIILALIILFLISPYVSAGWTAPWCRSDHPILDVVVKYESEDPIYKIYNPSITEYKGRLVCCARLCNGSYKSVLQFISSALAYKSTLCFLDIGGDYQISMNTIWPIGDVSYEDPRICVWRDSLWICATKVPFLGSPPKAVLIRLGPEFQLQKEYPFNLCHYGPARIYKNWAPFVHNGELFIHTDTYPIWKVSKVVIGDNRADLIPIVSVDNTPMKPVSEKVLRCSTSWVRGDDGYYYCGVHTKKYAGPVIVSPLMRSRFVRICPRTLTPLAWSATVCVDLGTHINIQFLSGLCYHRDEYHLAVGLGDYKFHIYKTPVLSCDRAS